MKTILIIEDTVEYAENLEILLTKEGYKVMVAANGKDGVVRALEKKPDLILMDILMPEQDGIETTRRIKELDALKQIPILFLTSVTGGEDVVVSVNGQSYPAISKVTDCDKLLALIKGSLGA